MLVCTPVLMILREFLRARARFLRVGVVLAGVGAGLGCASDTTGPRPISPAQLYWQLALNHHAITLALTPPYNTVQLVATPRAATGTLLADTRPTTYTVTDAYGNPDTNVTVSSTGLLMAVAPDAGIRVIAAHTIGQVTRVDTATVNVNDVTPVPHVAALVQAFPPGDSARWTSATLTTTEGVFGHPIATQSVLDSAGNPVPNVAIRFTASDSVIMVDFSTFKSILGFGALLPYRPERLKLIAEATVYGVSLTDTIQYTVGWPLVKVVHVVPWYPAGSRTPVGAFTPPVDTVAVGATVVWVNESGLPADVVFDDSTAAQSADSTAVNTGVLAFTYRLHNQASGNLPVWTTKLDTVAVYSDGSVQTYPEVQARRFPVAGTYRYHSALYGTTGVLYVLPEFQLP